LLLCCLLSHPDNLQEAIHATLVDHLDVVLQLSSARSAFIFTFPLVTLCHSHSQSQGAPEPPHSSLITALLLCCRICVVGSCWVVLMEGVMVQQQPMQLMQLAAAGGCCPVL